MRIVIAAALIAAQFAATAPANAAELVDGREKAQTRIGAFAGARLRLPLGRRQESRARVGLALAPISQSRAIDGRGTLRYGEGFEYGFAGREAASLRVAGYRVGPGGALSDARGQRLGVSTIGAAAIVGGVIVVGLVATALLIRSDED